MRVVVGVGQAGLLAGPDRLGQGLEDRQGYRRPGRVAGGRVLAEQVPVGAGIGQRESGVGAAAGQQPRGRVARALNMTADLDRPTSVTVTVVGQRTDWLDVSDAWCEALASRSA